jgi:hypothetical protein
MTAMTVETRMEVRLASLEGGKIVHFRILRQGARESAQWE